ncbi:hypothetical protein [Pseudorhodoferax sp. Leaf265]|uniref:hypothetical protein n=1 Tax=Pseudorhodoferax sp. Leaf265 TaxID=1736315 RepID=UPI0012E7F9BD|nr:hypothetical protein [Pseudorhodoferax sp. Leaf265]
MTCSDPSELAMRAMLQEHALLRAEINDRLKTAFSYVAYAGALLAFAMPMIEKC